MTPSTVVLQLLWWPSPGPESESGRLILHRVVTPEGLPHMGVSEFWFSSAWDELDLLSLEAAHSSAEWVQLVQGLRLRELRGPVQMTPADREQLTRLQAELPRRSIRSLFELHTRTRVAGEDRTVTSARLVRAQTDVLSSIFDAALHDTLAHLRLASAAREPNSATARLGGIHFEDVRGAQVGDNILQINTFVARAQRTEVSFDDVLRRSGVLDAVRALQAEPTSEALRGKLVQRLADPGWSLRSRPVDIEVAGREPTGLWEMLRSALFFDVRGLQVGDHTRQENRFVYAISNLPAGSDLLRENPRLAQALADQLCPLSAADRDVAQLRMSLRETLDALPVAWRDGRIRGLTAFPPGEGEVLRIRCADGVAVGHHVDQRVSEVTDFQAVTISTRVKPRIRDAQPVAAPGRPTEQERAEAAGLQSAAQRSAALLEQAQADEVAARHDADSARHQAQAAARAARRAAIAFERAQVRALAAHGSATHDEGTRRAELERAADFERQRAESAAAAAARAAREVTEADEALRVAVRAREDLRHASAATLRRQEELEEAARRQAYEYEQRAPYMQRY